MADDEDWLRIALKRSIIVPLATCVRGSSVDDLTLDSPDSSPHSFHDHLYFDPVLSPLPPPLPFQGFTPEMDLHVSSSPLSKPSDTMTARVSFADREDAVHKENRTARVAERIARARMARVSGGAQSISEPLAATSDSPRRALSALADVQARVSSSPARVSSSPLSPDIRRMGPTPTKATPKQASASPSGSAVPGSCTRPSGASVSRTRHHHGATREGEEAGQVAGTDGERPVAVAHGVLVTDATGKLSATHLASLLGLPLALTQELVCLASSSADRATVLSDNVSDHDRSVAMRDGRTTEEWAAREMGTEAMDMEAVQTEAETEVETEASDAGAVQTDVVEKVAVDAGCVNTEAVETVAMEEAVVEVRAAESKREVKVRSASVPGEGLSHSSMPLRMSLRLRSLLVCLWLAFLCCAIGGYYLTNARLTTPPPPPLPPPPPPPPPLALHQQLAMHICSRSQRLGSARAVVNLPYCVNVL